MGGAACRKPKEGKFLESLMLGWVVHATAALSHLWSCKQSNKLTGSPSCTRVSDFFAHRHPSWGKLASLHISPGKLTQQTPLWPAKVEPGNKVTSLLPLLCVQSPLAPLIRTPSPDVMRLSPSTPQRSLPLLHLPLPRAPSSPRVILDSPLPEAPSWATLSTVDLQSICWLPAPTA